MTDTKKTPKTNETEKKKHIFICACEVEWADTEKEG